jgi:hypothetical protein
MVAALAAIDPGLRDTAVVPVDPFISGHEPDGTPSRIERLAVVPLANILHKYADGRLLGFALLMPSTATTEQWRLVSEAVFGDERGLLEIRLGNTAVEVRRADRSSKAVGLAPSRYVTTAAGLRRLRITGACGGGSQPGFEPGRRRPCALVPAKPKWAAAMGHPCHNFLR